MSYPQETDTGSHVCLGWGFLSFGFLAAVAAWPPGESDQILQLHIQWFCIDTGV